ncbi:pectate lyase-like protein [Jejuia pallidilutea]|uniref:Pectate lyase-like protein n=1 Tax=Jejuia pallidilutea TaxID=504487 RepID=A0A362X439_9FLAO|nr:glycosyl hydrolase family 28-related protein [Jejuia pallidilutea]PQV51507.1 pectate lyase-like protein [Jejuia pallidilutea]
MKRRNFFNTALPIMAATMAVPTIAFSQNKERKFTKVINPIDFGAKGDGVTDDSDAIQKALDTLEDGSMFLLPTGSFLVTKTLFIRKKMNILFTGQGPGSKIIAGAPMQDLLNAEWPFSGSIIDSLCLDANSNAQVALRVMGGVYVQLNRLDIFAPLDIGIHGGPENPNAKCGPELIITNTRLTGMEQKTPEAPSSRLGILVEERWTDSHYDNLIIRGFTECAMELRANSNLINKVHVYRYPAYQYFSGMRLKGNENYLVQTYFDNAIDVGCEILGNNTTILSSYILRIALAFNNGKVAPGIGISIGSKDKEVSNVNIINTSFVNHVPNTPEYSANKLTGIQLINGKNVVAYDNQYDHTEFGDTRESGSIEVEKDINSKIVTLKSLVKPGNVQLTATSKITGNYWVSNVNEKSFTINFSEKQSTPCSFNYLTRE